MTLLLLGRWAWTVVALVGVILASRSLIESSLDLAARRSLGVNGFLVLTAKIMLRTAAIKLTCFLLFLAIGIVAVLNPTAPSVRASAIAWVLTIIEAALALGLEWNLRDRKRIRDRYLLEEEKPT